MTSALKNAKDLAGLSGQKTTRRRGVCTAIDPGSGLATFNINGGVQSMPMIGWPTVGWDAWILYIADQPICLGPVARSPWGIVTAAPAAGQVGVTGDDGVVSSLPYADSLTLTLGDRVVIDWAASVIVAEPAAEVIPDVPTPPIGGGGEVKSWTFFPRESGSFGSSWFTDKVYSSDSNLGAYFYDGIADTIPDDALIETVAIHLEADQALYADSNIGLHSLAGKSGPPDVNGPVPIARGTGDKALPASFGDLLKTGAMTGIVFAHGGYSIYKPANVDNSGALTITAKLP